MDEWNSTNCKNHWNKLRRFLCYERNVHEHKRYVLLLLSLQVVFITFGLTVRACDDFVIYYVYSFKIRIVLNDIYQITVEKCPWKLRIIQSNITFDFRFCFFTMNYWFDDKYTTFLSVTLLLSLSVLSGCVYVVCVCVKSFNFSHQKIIVNLFHMKLFNRSIYLWCDSFFLFFFENFSKVSMSTITNSMKINKNLTKWPATVCVQGIFFIYSMQFSSFAQYSLHITWVLSVFSLFFFLLVLFSSPPL